MVGEESLADAGPPSSGQMSGMSDWAKRKRAKTLRAALVPEVSLARFKENFGRSTAVSEAVKARFARLLSTNAANDVGHASPSLPASSNEPG